VLQEKGFDVGRARVVVTGMGLVTSLGVGVERNWEALCKGRSGIRKIDRFDVSDLACQIAGLVRDFDPEQFMDRKEVRRNDPFVHFGMAASEMAVAEAGPFIRNGNARRVGVVFGTGFGGLQTCEQAYHVLHEKGPGRMSPFYVPMIIPNLAAGQIAIRFGAKGPNLCFSTACSASTHSIGHAFRLVRDREADVVIAGGAEACVTRLGVSAFAAMRALSRRNDDPERACRPFERDRDGFVMGEGAGVLVLEEHGKAMGRGACILGEIIGYGQNGDAHHITAPSPEGEGAAECMRAALRDAQIEPASVEYLNAHGTGTPFNDLVETRAVKKVFGSHAARLFISGTKSMTGHLLGAVGAVEAVYTLLSLQHGILPPTINYENPDPECDLNYVPNVAQKVPIRVAMSNSFGFGGTNGSIVFKKYEERPLD
jgi:3-oxoacyl-[acyl-carrier-protein] synthase II